MRFLIRGRIPKEERNPINRFLIWVYHPVARLALRWRYVVVTLAVVAVLATGLVYLALGSEFMPPLWEETIMYMPVARRTSGRRRLRSSITYATRWPQSCTRAQR